MSTLTTNQKEILANLRIEFETLNTSDSNICGNLINVNEIINNSNAIKKREDEIKILNLTKLRQLQEQVRNDAKLISSDLKTLGIPFTEHTDHYQHHMSINEQASIRLTIYYESVTERDKLTCLSLTVGYRIGCYVSNHNKKQTFDNITDFFNSNDVKHVLKKMHKSLNG